jgi:hypothetical protein
MDNSVKRFISKRVLQILKLSQNDSNSKEINQYESLLDILICKIYNLTFEQAKTVDPEIAEYISKATYVKRTIKEMIE